MGLLRDPEPILRRILQPCTRAKLLQRLDFLGVDGQDVVHAQLNLAVDWSEHERLAAVRDRLRVDGRSIRQGAPELRGLLESIEETVTSAGLRVVVSLFLRPGADAGQVRSLLGLRAAPPTSLVRPVHDRMPVIVEPRRYDLWIDRAVQEPAALADVLRPLPAEAMRAYAANPWVNDARHDGARCLEPAA